MKLNETDLVNRHNRPSVTSKVALRTFFLNDGEYVDPYDISAVTIFSKLSNTTPDSIVDAETGIIKADQPATSIKMNFGISGGPPNTQNETTHTGVFPAVTSEQLNKSSWFPAYVPGTNASGIYRVGVGDYVAVLDGTLNLSGAYNLSENNFEVANTACSVQDYIDVWTIKFHPDSNWQLLINEFHLYDDTFFTVTEPVLVTPSNRLVNKHVTFGSNVNMKVTTELNFDGKELTNDIKNILKNFSVSEAEFTLQKVNEDSVNLPARITVTGTDVFSEMIVTSDNTMMARLNTENIKLENTAVGVPGTYVLTAKYQFLDQTFKTKGFYFVIN